MMKITIVLLAVIAIAIADKCDFKEKDYSTTRKGPRSKAEDDAEASATCQKGETLTACKCETFSDDKEPCDGSYIRETADGFFCIAKNNALGKGVVAVATCQKTVITCETGYKNMPSISCPDKFKPMSCTMHTSFKHQMNAGKPVRPVSKKSGNNCYTSKGCDSCKVQARCIRWTGF